jgi:hypothetical protein
MAKEILKLPTPLRKQLNLLARSEHGRIFVELLEEANRQYSDINTIDKNRDANAQIEGRQLMSEMITELTGYLKPSQTKKPNGELDDFTS